ncbi:hypothetical protein CERZMDRAFT_40542 [Cercospora zeae-maydis SCOH1-5]|uniref:Pre-mRNA-splicing factor n=1 Tax=Cercospora zeae-maydis SCOH1-5 TaxID=717836 RepID=A0A6A6FI46_9PEZI|nr:hypothetical protein CERZMDRAFT_40542 [Cercospora zeae-maydis SCOH1-5]
MSGNKISLALGGARKAPPPASGVKRPRAALYDEEDDGSALGRTEKVSHFDSKAGGAVDASSKKKEQGPLKIAPQPNRDWREKATQRKRQKSGLPECQNGNTEVLNARMREVEAKVEASKPKFGLNTYKNGVEAEDETMSGTGGDAEQSQENGKDVETARAKTDDELAMDALLGKTSTDKTLVIESRKAPMTEEDAFDHDIASAPHMATLDDYARVPVEQFGAALLRGMGWKDGEGIGSQKGSKIAKDSAKPPERRAALLGIGAKENAAITQEIGAWGKAARGKEAKIYNPDEYRRRKEKERRRKREREDDFDRESSRRRKDHEDGGRERHRDRDRRDRDRERERDHRR